MTDDDGAAAYAATDAGRLRPLHPTWLATRKATAERAPAGTERLILATWGHEPARG